MKKYFCGLCGYEYNRESWENDVKKFPESDFEDLPDDWICPMCGASKEDFEAVEREGDNSDTDEEEE